MSDPSVQKSMTFSRRNNYQNEEKLRIIMMMDGTDFRHLNLRRFSLHLACASGCWTPRRDCYASKRVTRVGTLNGPALVLKKPTPPHPLPPLRWYTQAARVLLHSAGTVRAVPKLDTGSITQCVFIRLRLRTGFQSTDCGR